VIYRIRIGKRVRKEMARLPRQDQARILTAIKALAEDPRPVGCRPVKGADKSTYRVRVGDYRVIYTVLDDEGEKVIIVARVVRRSERTYRGLR
jgi:mRNA interferase RelE/StbE